MKYLAYFENVRKGSRVVGILSDEKIEAVLADLAAEAVANTEYLLVENKKDLDRMDPEDPKYDRLKLTAERIEGIAADIINVSKLQSPLGKVLMEKTLPNGLELSKITVPLGVVSVIYESRPNVTFDVFSLCFKTGNACLLKGSSDAEYSNLAIIDLIHRVLQKHEIDTNVAQLLPAERAATGELMEAVDYVDIIIPRGSQGLINFVRDNSKVPVIETGAGIVHTYYDKEADLEKGKAIIVNAKTRRVSVCNALDCLVIHQDRLSDLPAIVEGMKAFNVEIFADAKAFSFINGHYPAELLQHASEEHFGIEFLSHKMSIKTVESFDEAVEHITEFSSKHSEAIVTENKETAELFLKLIDAAAVYVNTTTAYTDGAQFGLGAEIGISTQKLHARGPMALEELTSYKWLIIGNGQIRS
ncbi:glutamate-5-semialdehyde dehydrogenase [Flammeovirgaceae bacterium SG7u.111]|nr:glutamate-5-semialdehyde dehydrogenase [Flammeovirgaceae bacterium SG7u.132]WPO37380.1 glutamate-5-semialdehyde dehydrogenase [Flammeovirgaceae bacterium SG7u.111]